MSNEPLQYESPRASGWTKHEVAVLVVKVIAIHCVLQALPLFAYLPSAVYYILFSGSTAVRWNTMDFVLFAIHPVVYLAAGVGLWVMSGWVARQLVSQGSGEPAVLPAVTELHQAALSVIGVLLMVWGITEAAQLLVHDSITDPFGSAGRTTFYGGLLIAVIQFVLGLVLFLRARGLALLWQKIRTGGVQPPDSAR